MSIVPDDGDERQTRVDRMIAEFRNAQLRRLPKATTVNGDNHVAELPRDAHAPAVIAGVNADTDFTRELE